LPGGWRSTKVRTVPPENDESIPVNDQPAEKPDVLPTDQSLRTGDPLSELTRELVLDGLWHRPHLSVRDRRLITMTILAMHGIPDYLNVHVRASLEKNELSIEELQELAIQVAFYAGWPVGNKLQVLVTEAAANQT
jgi:4-carboxymuconolactone decarboxylase